ncbi:threonine synthase-like 1 [Huso huso]|uniref:Threonine synthase-like 1 n=1 Tax=Huso huso TaxID=61971 RepID=A0ABR0ZZN7_HUSHU
MVPVSSFCLVKLLLTKGRLTHCLLTERKTFKCLTTTFLCAGPSTACLSTLGSSIGKKNILIMGPPGAGKTTVGRIIGHKLGLPVIDVDDDILEKAWDMTVAEKLSKVGGEQFLEEEGRALLNFTISGSVISLTGSNPIHSRSMEHVKQNGLAVYLDVCTEDIIERLERMKVDRIVGQGPDVSMRDILQYRQQFYKKWYDTRVLCGAGDTPDEIADKVLEAVKRYQDSESETFVSTRGSNTGKMFFSDVIVEGLAPDGGLYVPLNGLPKLTSSECQRLVDMSFPERAQVLLERCIHPADVPSAHLLEIVERAYGENFACSRIAPVRHLMHNQYVLELFHGPTASFKDLSLQLMPQLFAYCIPQTCNYLVLVATSGDTGSAVLEGFNNLSDIDKQRISVLAFFPEKGISSIQKMQMTRYVEGNVKAVGVNSDFDFCQRAIKKMFTNAELTGFLAVEYGTALTTANSINWARLLPQVVYHSSAYFDLVSQGVLAFGDPIDVCIPTGNFGNVLAAVYAKRMGIPIRKLICASNQNHILTDFLRTGEYDLNGRRLLMSASPSIDILKSSNLERYLYLISNGDWQLVRDLYSQLERQNLFRVPGSLLERIQQDFLAGWCSEEECLATIQSVHSAAGYILDPHTAVAKVVADRLQDGTCPVVIASTAHYAKFAPAVLKALKFKEVTANPLHQLELLRSLGSLPSVHNTLLESLKEEDKQKHKVCEADHNALIHQVETFIQDKFMKVW